MSPNLRRAAHSALDMLLDALEDEQREQPRGPKRRNKTTPWVPAIPADATPEEIEDTRQRLARAGLRKAG